MKRVLIATLLLVGCDDSNPVGDASSDTAVDTTADTTTDTEIDPPADTSADTIDATDAVGDPDGEPEPGSVLLSCYELEIGVNVDAAPGESMLRWYGSFFLEEEGTVVTNVEVTSLTFDTGDTVREAVSPSVAWGPLDELPELQERVRGGVEPTAGEIADCVTSGPALTRGSFADEVTVTMTGSSDQGDWSASCTMSQEGLIRTCHSGLSLMGDGYAFSDLFPDPPEWFTDVSVQVYATAGSDLSEITVASAVLGGEGASETFDFSTTCSAYESSGVSDHFGIYHIAEGKLPEELCPDIATGYPPELYITYEGSTPSGSFSGAAPAGQCAYGEI